MFKQKYDAHIRIKFSIFDDPNYKSIPNKQKAHCLSVFVSLLKFVNNKTLQCYPRKATISSMTGLSYTTIYRATIWLIKVGMVSKKRLPSTLMYKINPNYIVGYRESVPVDRVSVPKNRSEWSGSTLLEEPTYTSTINNLIKKISNNGGDKNVIIKELASLPPDTLKEAISNNDNPYYCMLAIQEQSRNLDKLVDIPNKKELLEKIRKKTNFAYQRVIAKRKDYNGRETKTKSFLSNLNKKKS
jgi:hypothetical protein